MPGLTSIGPVVVPISVIRTGDKNAITKLKAELRTVSAELAKMNAASLQIKPQLTDGFFEKGEEFTSTLSTANKETMRYGITLSKTQQELAGVLKEYNNYNRLIKDGIPLTAAQQREFDKLSTKVQKYGGVVQTATKQHRDFLSIFTRIRWAIVNVAMIAGVAAGFYKLAKSAAEVRLEFIKLGFALNTSLSDARAMFDDVRKSSIASNKELIAAYQELAKAGFNVAETQKLVKAANEVAIIGFTDVKSAAMAAAQVLRQFKLDVSSAEDVMYKLSAASKRGRVDVGTLGMAFKFAGAVANQAGTSFDDTLVTVTALSNSGLQLTQIGRGLRQAFVSLLSPTKQAQNILSTYDIQIKTASGELKSFIDIIEELHNKLSALPKAEQQAILAKLFPTNALTVINEAIGQLETMKTMSGDLDKMVKTEKINAVLANSQEVVKMTSAWERFKMVLADVGSAAGYAAESMFYANVASASRTQKLGITAEDVKLALDYAKANNANKEVINELSVAYDALRGKTTMQTAWYTTRDLKLAKEMVARINEIKEGETSINTITKLISSGWAKLVGLTSLFKKNLSDTTTTGVINEFNKRLEVYVKNYETAKDLVTQFNSEVAKIKSIYGDSVMAQELINQLMTRYSTLAQQAGNSIQNIFNNLVKIKGVGLDFSVFDSLLGTTQSKYEKLQPFYSSLMEALASKANAPTWYKTAIPALMEQLNTGETRLKELKNRQIDLKNAVDLANDALNREKDVLSNLNSELSKTESRINALKGSRFFGETKTLEILKKAQLYLKKQELAALGVADAHGFINEALSKSDSELETLFGTLSRVNSELERNQSAFEAWQKTITTAIRAEIEAGISLGSDVTQRVKTWQTALMAISSTGMGGQQQTQLDEFVNKLQLAYDIHFGGMHDEVTNFLMQQEDRELGVFDTSSQLIAALTNEMAVRESLKESIVRQQSVIETLTDEVTKAKEDLAAVIKDIADQESQITSTITAIKELGEAVDRLKDKMSSWNYGASPYRESVSIPFPFAYDIPKTVKVEDTSGTVVKIESINIGSNVDNPTDITNNLAYAIQRVINGGA